MSRRREWFLNISVAIATIAAVTMTVLRIRELRQSAAAKAANVARRGPRQVPAWQELGSVGNRLGPSSAPVTIVEFSDFRCPFCKLQADDLREIRQRYPKDVTVVYRHLTNQGHSRDAAVASECAGRAGAFEAYHDLLFTSRDSIGLKPWTEFALQAGVRDTTIFAACLLDVAVASAVERDRAVAAALQVRVTPTLVINNLLVPGHTTADSLEKFIRAALRSRVVGVR